MSKLDEVTLGDVGRVIARYRPYIAVVTAIVLVVAFLPGQRDGRDEAALTTAGGGPGAGAPGLDGEDIDLETGEAGAELEGGSEGLSSAGGGTRTAAGQGAGTSSAGGGGSGGGGVAGTSSAGGGGSGGGGAQMVANCDPKTGRIAIPSNAAPACVPAFAGDNGGATYRGVGKDTIKIAVYRIRESAATNAVLTAAGVNDSEEAQRQQYKEWAQFYEAHYQTYGRKVQLVFVPGSGAADDDAAARADARKVIEMGAFASWEAPNNTYVDELVANGVMCFCTTTQPHDNYLRWAPYVWNLLMSSHQAYTHRAEYIGKRVAHRKAVHAGDPLMKDKQRVFGLLYYETADFAYKSGIDFFEQELASKYNVRLKVRAAYRGYPDVQYTQRDAPALIQKLKDEGVTSVILAVDPFGPIFFTEEATRQRYFPEWIITGSALTDTAFFARLYNQEQWSHAFGISLLPARVPEELSENYRLFHWHYGRPPTAEGRYSVIATPIKVFYEAVHYAGPNLRPETIRDGLFNMPPTNRGGITYPSFSYGRHGVWPWDDYLAFDDVTEIWWDRTARGEDEIGQDGTGLYRYVDGGKRYLPGQHPKTDAKAFITEGTSLIYDKPPDQWPQYPPPKRK